MATPLSAVLAKKQPATISDAIEELGVGPVQWRQSLLSGLVWFSAGAQLIVFSGVGDNLKRECHLTGFQNGTLVSLALLGNGVGFVLGGFAGDRFGRKLPVVSSCWLVFVFGTLSAAASAFWSFSIFRTFIGLSFGFGEGVAVTMASETVPATWRLTFAIVTNVFFSLGEIFGGLLMMVDDPSIVNSHWGVLPAVAAAPSAAFGLLAALFLHESPIWVESTGQHGEAVRIVELMRRENGLPELSATLAPTPCGSSEVSLGRQLRMIFGSKMLATTCIVICGLLVTNVTFYGTVYAFPQVMVRDVSLGSSPAMDFVLGAFVELGGYALGIMCTALPRRPTLMVVFALQAASLVAFAVAAPHMEDGWRMQALAWFGYFGPKFLTCVSFMTTYVYAAEVYPTAARALGMSVVMSSGRVAAVLAPEVFELLFAITDYSFFFWFTALLNVAVLPLVLLLHETVGQQLPEEDCSEATAVLYGTTVNARIPSNA